MLLQIAGIGLIFSSGLTVFVRMSNRRYGALSAIGSGWCTFWAALDHSSVAYGSAALTALSIYLWWISGGGDDTKKRLRKLANAFIPVRRTAPQT